MAAKKKLLEFDSDFDDIDGSMHSSELSELDSDVHSLSSLRSCAQSWIEDVEYKAPAEGWVKFATPAAMVRSWMRGCLPASCRPPWGQLRRRLQPCDALTCLACEGFSAFAPSPQACCI